MRGPVAPTSAAGRGGELVERALHARRREPDARLRVVTRDRRAAASAPRPERLVPARGRARAADVDRRDAVLAGEVRAVEQARSRGSRCGTARTARRSGRATRCERRAAIDGTGDHAARPRSRPRRATAGAYRSRPAVGSALRGCASRMRSRHGENPLGQRDRRCSGASRVGRGAGGCERQARPLRNSDGFAGAGGAARSVRQRRPRSASDSGIASASSRRRARLRRQRLGVVRRAGTGERSAPASRPRLRRLAAVELASSAIGRPRLRREHADHAPEHEPGRFDAIDAARVRSCAARCGRRDRRCTAARRPRRRTRADRCADAPRRARSARAARATFGWPRLTSGITSIRVGSCCVVIHTTRSLPPTAVISPGCGSLQPTLRHPRLRIPLLDRAGERDDELPARRARGDRHARAPGTDTA